MRSASCTSFLIPIVEEVAERVKNLKLLSEGDSISFLLSGVIEVVKKSGSGREGTPTW
jgi:hypothetical protein